MLDGASCWRALVARDARFDGRFFVGVSTTGIYCRPICPARTPRRDRCSFHRSAAAAEKAGFRACFRCRPELAPGSASVEARSRLVAHGLAAIAAGRLDRGSVEDLAEELGVSARHLRRSFERELGLRPVELAQSRRLGLAKHLLHDTSLSLTRIALASGFASVRRFNTAFVQHFGRSPSSLRKSLGRSAKGSGITLRLDFRPPLDFEACLEFLAKVAWPRVETIEADCWRRRIGEREVRVSLARGRNSLRVEIDPELADHVAAIVAGVRRTFDLDARPSAVAEVLAGDPLLRPLLRRRPGLRLPGAFDPFETAIAGVLGQRVSVAAARTLCARLDALIGPPVPNVLARAGLARVAGIGLPNRQARALIELARAWPQLGCAPGADPELLCANVCAIDGLGPWTAHYLCMRVLSFPDAFPAGDLALRRACAEASSTELERRAEAWRPWRAYAAMHLWTAYSKGELP